MKKLLAVACAVLFAGVSWLPAQTQGQWTSTGNMQSARELNAQVAIKGGKVLSAGGRDNNGNVLASAELYNPTTGKWALTGNMLQAREEFPAVVLASGKVLVAGGLTANGVVLAAAELYDPTTGAWSSAAPLTVARLAHTAVVLPGGKVLVTGGCTASDCSVTTAASEIYDPVSNNWSSTNSMNTARAFHTAVPLSSGKVLVAGGLGALSSCELYDPVATTWSNVASTNAGRYLHTMTLLADGKVLVTGGASGKYPVASAEIYDPVANKWTLTGNMTIGRYAHTAALLGDGTVVLAGGIAQPISCGKDCVGYIPTNKVDVFNEAAGTFAAASGLSQSLAYHSMTMLATGRALEDGGIATTATCCIVTNTASFYTPLTLTFSASSLNFGLLQIGLTSRAQTVTVANVSSHAVKFTSIAASGDFAETNNCPATMAAGQNCSISVTFKPTAQGSRSGAVTLKDNSPGSPKQTIALAGTGETLALGFTPSAINFGGIVVGSSGSQTATLTNDGTSALNLTGFSIAPAGTIYTQTNNCPATLGVQQSCTFSLVFTPPDVFTYNATLSVTNSAGSAATLTLTGNGLNN